MKNIILAGFLLAVTWAMPGRAGADESLSTYPDCRLVPSDVNDADSFIVDTGHQQLHVRLYFVDSPERFVHQPHDARRVQEQSRYFGIENADNVVRLGQRASDFTKDLLRQPFTVYTAHARALGGATSERIYAFVVTADGRDLGDVLVENGLARNFGVSRMNYAGVSHAEVEEHLRDLEIAAMLKRKGVWEVSNPDLIVKYRALQRQERQEMQMLMTTATKLLDAPVNINTAEQRDLEKIPGVGPVTAGRIIAGRPYASIDDLKQQPGIGEKTFERIAPYLSIEDPKSSNG